MRIRLNIRQTKDGQWAHFIGANKYYLASVRPTEREARIEALRERAREAQDVIDAVDSALRKLGALDERDPHDYLA